MKTTNEQILRDKIDLAILEMEGGHYQSAYGVLTKAAALAATEAPAALHNAFMTMESNGEGRSLVLKFNQRDDAYAVHDFLLRATGATHHAPSQSANLSNLPQWQWDYSGMEEANNPDAEMRYVCVADLKEGINSDDQVRDAALAEAAAMCRAQRGDLNLKYICEGAAVAIESLKRKPAAAPESAEPSADVVTNWAALNEVASFLMGSTPLEGVIFGERHPTKAGLFWWRLNLRAALCRAKA